MISPDFEPVSIFWHSNKATPTAALPPNQGSKYSYTFTNPSNQIHSSDDPKEEPVGINVPPRTKAAIGSKKPLPKNERAVQVRPKGVSVKENESNGEEASGKTSIWDRLGGIVEEPSVKQTKVTKIRPQQTKATKIRPQQTKVTKIRPQQTKVTKIGSRNTDEDWTPQEVVDGGADDEDEDEGVSEGHDFLSELGNKVTGDEMDTIARNADHSHFLRSLMQSDSHGGPTSNTQVHMNTGVQQRRVMIDSHQLYIIPVPDVSLLQPPRGSTASEYYDSLNARDQEIRKGGVKLCVYYLSDEHVS